MKEQQINAKLAQYDALQEKVRLMEERQAAGEAAASLMSQFIETGAVRDEGQGNFTVTGVNGEQTFTAFPEQQ